MNINKTLKKIGVITVILLCFLVNIGYAESQKNEEILKGYISNGYDEKQLKQRNTLLRFQAENNLTVNGILEESTNEALNETNKVIVDILPKEVMEEKWFIVINQDKKILTVYSNGEIYKKYPVALGKSSTPTPNYKFTIINKAKNPYWGGMGGKFKPVKGGAPNNPLGKRWLGLSTEKHTGYGIHGNSSPFSIGKYISNGCIRMINEDVEELFEYMPTKTKVWVGTEEILEGWGVKQDIKYEKVEKMVRKVDITKLKCDFIENDENKEKE
ncbi:L,D-transpeptidase [Tissierella sp. MSJ-40]|uniref:L,D-transpeptidase n=1 Tax=Tissierella simiarum TaxID=2841534 RepID=A0ABS6EB56_9FIRM|nr:L,D-transpeptidase [Tissierella simiarum]MBU5440163.1 L,D-transpeptidase [Tissierella simiarum]